MAEWGKDAPWADQVEAETGRRPPIPRPPELDADEAEIAKSWGWLSHYRENGIIKLSTIRDYIELFGTADTEAFVRLIRAVDSAWLAAVRAKEPQK
ncbi:hypothetical protein [Azospirillum brasilense]|uniref:hypothetical protein n=1 Tax=Azospirillum brasilense TaxID=192 RepID=UPI000E69E520|nr:hypothetical protein [Azospirillum brasilense]NUB24709.1 hypothetical protein [Azospirillum brasilense]NUB30688.1 hypothetical protein [Azospirillum brasilense]RIW08297.1 hypothetical protein D2T81_00870 [Azospirillum brasilense]